MKLNFTEYYITYEVIVIAVDGWGFASPRCTASMDWATVRIRPLLNSVLMPQVSRKKSHFGSSNGAAGN